MTYDFSFVSPTWVQIHGEVHGFAVRHFSENRHYWLVSFYTFLANGVQLKVSTSEKERTLGSLADVRKWIDMIVARESAQLTETA